VTSDRPRLAETIFSRPGWLTIFGDVFTLALIMGGGRHALDDCAAGAGAFAVLAAHLFVTQWFRRNVRDSYRAVRALHRAINAFLQENVTGMTTVQCSREQLTSSGSTGSTAKAPVDANIDSIFYYRCFTRNRCGPLRFATAPHHLVPAARASFSTR